MTASGRNQPFGGLYTQRLVLTQSGRSWPLKKRQIKLTDWTTRPFLLRLISNNEKAKPAKRRGRKATGPRFLREAMEDLPKDPKIAGLPSELSAEGWQSKTLFSL